MAILDTMQRALMCVVSPTTCIDAASAVAEEGYRIGGGPGDLAKGAEIASAAAGASTSAIVRNAGDAVRGAIRDAEQPLERAEGIARWVGIAILAILGVVIVVAAMYFAAPILSVLRS